MIEANQQDASGQPQKFKGLLANTHTVALLVFICALVIFKSSPVHSINDSKYSMLLSQNLLEHRSFQLDHYAIPRLEPIQREDYVQNGEIYQIEQVGPHLYYFFPPGTSILSTPFVLVANALGVSVANADGTFNLHSETLIERWVAAILMAALAAIFFSMARLMLPTSYSLMVTAAATLGTQIWSTTSRAMFSDTWAVLLLGLVLLIVLRHETKGARLHPILVATILLWAYIVYPLYAVHIAAISAYFFFFHRRQFILYVATAVCWLAAFAFYSWHNFRQLLPNYFHANRLGFGSFTVALPGNLISPSRGLLVFVPTVFLVAYLLLRFRSRLRHKRLVVVALGAMLAHLVVISGFAHWWGGHSYGPRLTTALVPWLVLLSILGLRAMFDTMTETASLQWRRRSVLVCGALLVAVSIFIHGRGAFSQNTIVWNSKPVNVDKQPARLWDWRQPQFLAGLLPPPPPDEYPFVVADTLIDFTQPEASKYLWYGWSGPEQDGRWTESTQAKMVFALNEIRPLTLNIRMTPFLVSGRLDEQRVSVSLNGTSLGDWTVKEPGSLFSIPLPLNALRQKNVLTLAIPNASSPAELQISEDARQLGVQVGSMQFVTR